MNFCVNLTFCYLVSQLLQRKTSIRGKPAQKTFFETCNEIDELTVSHAHCYGSAKLSRFYHL